MEGKCKITYSSGSSYEGEVKNGKLCGYGVFKYANGNVYSGEWEDNKQNGEGEFMFAGETAWESGDVYKGSFKNGKFHGFGHYQYKKFEKQYIGKAVQKFKSQFD